jgi:hypothetical protein
MGWSPYLLPWSGLASGTTGPLGPSPGRPPRASLDPPPTDEQGSGRGVGHAHPTEGATPCFYFDVRDGVSFTPDEVGRGADWRRPTAEWRRPQGHGRGTQRAGPVGADCNGHTGGSSSAASAARTRACSPAPLTREKRNIRALMEPDLKCSEAKSGKLNLLREFLTQ